MGPAAMIVQALDCQDPSQMLRASADLMRINPAFVRQPEPERLPMSAVSAFYDSHQPNAEASVDNVARSRTDIPKTWRCVSTPCGPEWDRRRVGSRRWLGI